MAEFDVSDCQKRQQAAGRLDKTYPKKEALKAGTGYENSGKALNGHDIAENGPFGAESGQVASARPPGNDQGEGENGAGREGEKGASAVKAAVTVPSAESRKSYIVVGGNHRQGGGDFSGYTLRSDIYIGL